MTPQVTYKICDKKRPLNGGVRRGVRRLEDPDAGQHCDHRSDSDDLVDQVLLAARPD